MVLSIYLFHCFALTLRILVMYILNHLYLLSIEFFFSNHLSHLFCLLSKVSILLLSISQNLVFISVTEFLEATFYFFFLFLLYSAILFHILLKSIHHLLLSDCVFNLFLYFCFKMLLYRHRCFTDGLFCFCFSSSWWSNFNLLYSNVFLVIVIICAEVVLFFTCFSSNSFNGNFIFYYPYLNEICLSLDQQQITGAVMVW